jgi:hypothetical protein
MGQDRGPQGAGRIRPARHGEHPHLLVAATAVDEYLTDDIPDQLTVDTSEQ